MAAKRKSKGAYMISAVAEMYEIHPQTLRLYEREGLLLPSRTEGNTRLYTDEDLERLEFILNLARDLGVNIAGIAIILQMRERMEEMNRQMQSFVEYVRTEMLTRFQQVAPSSGATCWNRVSISVRTYSTKLCICRFISSIRSRICRMMAIPAMFTPRSRARFRMNSSRSRSSSV